MQEENTLEKLNASRPRLATIPDIAMTWILAKRQRTQSLRRIVHSLKPIRVTASSARFGYSTV